MPINRAKLTAYLGKPQSCQESTLMLPQNKTTLDPSALMEGNVVKFDVNKNGILSSALHSACYSGKLAEIKILLENGEASDLLDKQVCNQHGVGLVTPLYCAISSGKSEALQLLVEHGANANICCGDPDKGTSLHLAAASSHGDALQILLKSGASPSIQNAKGQQPLHLAAAANVAENIGALLDAGADQNAKDMNGKTPLHYAVLNAGTAALDCVRILLRDERVDINAQDSEGYTPIHLSSMNESSKIAALLLRNGCDVTLKTTTGITAMSMLARKLPDVTNCLVGRLDSGVRLNKSDPTDVNCEIKMDFGVLIPPKRESLKIDDAPKKKRFSMGSTGSSVRRKETELLTCLLATGNKKLLAHPLPETFLLVKWRRVRKFFLASLLFQMALVALFTIFVVEVYLIRCPYRRGNGISNEQTAPHILSKRHAVPYPFPREFTWFGLEPRINRKRPINVPVQFEPPQIHNSPDSSQTAFGPVVPQFKRPANGNRLSNPGTSAIQPEIPPEDESASEMLPEGGDEGLRHGTSFASTPFTPATTEDASQELPPPHECSLDWSIYIIWFLLVVFICLMSIQEIFQMVHSPRRYLVSSENWAQWLLIASVLITTLRQSGVDGDTFRLAYWQYPSAACGILIAWGLILFQVGRFPSLGLYVEMLGKVATNFGLFILAYACLLIAFALSFCVLFPEHPPFSSVPLSILKVFTMMVGEVDYEDLFYSEERLHDPILFPLTAHLLFGAFVLIMTIVLMNLLVGLAVSDIQGLQKGAKLDRLSRQTSLIARFESFIFSKKLQAILPSSMIQLIQNNSLLKSMDTSVSVDQLSFYFRPNDPRDRSVPKDIKQSALRLVSSQSSSQHHHAQSYRNLQIISPQKQKSMNSSSTIDIGIRRSVSSVSHRPRRDYSRCDSDKSNRSVDDTTQSSGSTTFNLNHESPKGTFELMEARFNLIENKLENMENRMEKITELLMRINEHSLPYHLTPSEDNVHIA